MWITLERLTWVIDKRIKQNPSDQVGFKIEDGVYTIYRKYKNVEETLISTKNHDELHEILDAIQYSVDNWQIVFNKYSKSKKLKGSR